MRPLWVKLSITFGFIILCVLTLVIVIAVYNQLGRVPNSLPPPETFVEALQRMPRFVVFATTFALTFGLVGGIVISRTLTAPLSELAEGVKDVGSGNLNRRIVGRGSAEIVELAQAINQMAFSLEEAQQQRNDLIADISHELRTPLTVLQGNLRAMLDGLYPLSQEEIVKIYSQTRQMARLVDDLHMLTKFEARQFTIDLQQVDPIELIKHSIAVFDLIVEEQGLNLDLDIPSNLPDIEVDPIRIEQVLGNLISNAIRHTPEGGTILVKVRHTADSLQIAVTDTGEGIAPDKLAHVFERFTRVDGSRTRATGGSGLGLAIVKAIVEEGHNGNVKAYSKGLGEGTTFTVSLPLRH